MTFATLLPARADPALRIRQLGLLLGPLARVPDQRHQRADRVDPPARRHPLHRRRGRAAPLHLLPRRPPPSQAQRLPRSPTRSCSPRSPLLRPETSAAVSPMQADEGNDEHRGPARCRLRGVPARRRDRARPARPPLAPPQHPLPDSRVQLPPGPRPLGVPGGTAPAPGRDRPPAAPGRDTAPAPRSATPARRRPSAPTPIAVARSLSRSTHGRTRRPDASTAGSASSSSPSLR